MIKDDKIQRSIVLPKALAEKVNLFAKENYTTFNSAIRQILIEYFKSK